MNDYKKAFLITWDIIGVLVTIGFILLLSVPQSIILDSLPICRWQYLYQKPCFLCGMGRALTAIAHGHIHEAFSLNIWSIPLVAVLILNEFIWISRSVMKYLKSSR